MAHQSPTVAFAPPAALGKNWPTGALVVRPGAALPNNAARSQRVDSAVGSPVAGFITSVMRCMKLFVNSSRPSLPPVPSSGGNFAPSCPSTNTASSQPSASSGKEFRQLWSSSVFVSPSGFAFKVSCFTSRRAAAIPLRYCSNRTALPFSIAVNALSLSFGKKPLPPFQARAPPWAGNCTPKILRPPLRSLSS